MKSLLLLCFLFLFTNVLSAQNRYDIVINEVMTDPSPQVGLPANEWIELKNASSFTINLQGWRLGDSGGQSGPMPDFNLAPESFVIVCTGSAVAAMAAFGSAISVTSFPSLDNDGELLFVKAPNGMIVHALDYSSSWYQNDLKKGGGWSLEMIDSQNPCTGSANWKASTDSKGGTPGTINSVNAANNDQIGPVLKNGYTTDHSTIVLLFNEPLDSAGAAILSNYRLDGGISLISAETISPTFNRVDIKTSTPLQAGVIYHITANNVADCKGNKIGSANKSRVAIAEVAAAGDCIINEILFNPRSNAYDYVEFYNKSNKVIDIARLYIANRNSNNAISSITPLSQNPFYIFPGDYIVVTEDADNLSLNYLVKDPADVITISSLPSFPDDEGVAIILNQQGEIMDEVNYSAEWHFKLIDNAEGVSLERIDFAGASQTGDNWHSAASTAGYGTPGFKNSQYKNQQSQSATIDVTPKVFSPDNDGYDDIATIQYKIAEPGYVANITIFDAAGRPVRNLVRNSTLSTEGYWNWDGLDNKGLKLAVGNYILFTEIFNLQGKTDRFKNTIVLARKLN